MNLETPFFSIILPTYNRALLLPAAIDSVLQQTFSNWELLVIDDGSTDETRSVVHGITELDARIRYIYQENAERSAARNNGISNARGTYLCFLDSDDRFTENCLDTLHRHLQDWNLPKAFVVFNARMITPEGQESITTTFTKQTTNPAQFVFGNSIATPRACVHHSILNKENFNEQLRIGEDKELWSRIIQIAPLKVIHEVLVEQVIHEERSVTEGHYKGALDGLKAHRLILKNNAHFAIQVNTKDIKNEVSNSMQSVAVHYMWTNKRMLAIKYLFQAIITAPWHPHFKLRLNAIIKLLMGKPNQDVARMCR